MQHLNFWVFNIETAFVDFKSELEQLLDVRNFDYDNENYWEYMTGFSKKYHSKINVSRPHKETMDLPKNEIPLHLIFYACSELFIEQIGHELNHFFRLPVHFGSYTDKSTNSERHFKFHSEKVFNKIDLSGLLKASE